nr:MULTISPECIES: helix-turn-helix transcriptional regulator [unclassified Labrenzia]
MKQLAHQQERISLLRNYFLTSWVDFFHSFDYMIGCEGRTAMATSEIGKELRKLRIDNDERLLDMAGRLNKSAAFLSAIETGKKTPPTGFEELVANAYGLMEAAAVKLRRAADRSRKAFTIEAHSVLAKDTAGLLARKMDTLSDQDLKNILQVLRKGDAD